MKKFFQILFVVFGCLHLLGGPYAMIQIYAWGTMLAGYSQESGVLKGARQTFSGERPCKLCCKIAAAEGSELENNKRNLPEKPKETAKLVQEMLPGEVHYLTPPDSVLVSSLSFGELSTWYRDFIALPPTPPPRDVA